MRYQSKGDYLTAVAPSQERELKLASNHEPKLRNQVAPSQERELKYVAARGDDGEARSLLHRSVS